MPAKENHSALRAGFRKIGPSPIFLKKQILGVLRASTGE
jgi:hypothetical protein